MSAPVRVTAQMVASVLRVLKRSGDVVTGGETLLVVESMKMEMPIISPVTGMVQALEVGPGDIIEEGDVLAVIDTES